MPTPVRSESALKRLNAAVALIRRQGLAATSVDDICRAAGFSKGAFVHHFKSKEDLVLAAAEHFTMRADALFDAAPCARLDNPRARILAYLDFRKSILRGEPADYTCLLGTIAQEAHETHPPLREARGGHLGDHAARVATDLAAAKALYALDADWRPKSAALFILAVPPGAFVLAKAHHSAEIAADCLDHLRDYVERRLPVGGRQETEVARKAA